MAFRFEFRRLQEQNQAPAMPLTVEKDVCTKSILIFKAATHMSNSSMEEDTSVSAVREEASTSKTEIEKNDAPSKPKSPDELGSLATTKVCCGSIPHPEAEEVEMDLEELPSRNPVIIVHKNEVIESSPKNNGRIENAIDIHEVHQTPEPSNRPREVLRTYNGIRKDNKEELGRCLDFLDKNMMNLRFRISDKEYVIDSCNITISPVKKNSNIQNEVMDIKKDGMSCENSNVDKFMKDSVYSYREKLSKSSICRNDTDSIPSPPDSDSVEPYKNESTTGSKKYLSHNREYELREISTDLVKKINYDKTHPTIKDMLTVPVHFGDLRGYVFASLTAKSIMMHYYSEDNSLQQMLKETDSTLANFTYTMLHSKHIHMLLSCESIVEKFPFISLTDYVHRRTFGWESHVPIVNETHNCECWCGKMLTSQPEAQPKRQPEPPMEELKEAKPIAAMVDCDYCGKVYKESTNHKCKKTKLQEKTISCMVCDRTFSRQAHLSNHLRSHKDYMKATVKCELCNKRIPKGELREHKAECHPETLNEFSCEQCGKVLLSAYKLNKHIRDIHGIVDSDHQLESSNSRTVYAKVTVHNSPEESSGEKANYTAAEVLEDHNRTSSNSKIGSSVGVAMKSFTAIRSVRNTTDPDTYYTNVDVTEGYENENDMKILRPRRRKRLMYSEVTTSESESEEPPRKRGRSFKSDDSSGDESYYIGREILPGVAQDDAVLNRQADNSVDNDEGNEITIEYEQETAQNYQMQEEETEQNYQMEEEEEMDYIDEEEVEDESNNMDEEEVGDEINNMDEEEVEDEINYIDQEEYNLLTNELLALSSNIHNEDTEFIDEEVPLDDPLSPEELDQIIAEAAIRTLDTRIINEVNDAIGENTAHSEVISEVQHDSLGTDVGVTNTNIVNDNTMQVEGSSSANGSCQQSTNMTDVNLNNVANTSNHENAR